MSTDTQKSISYKDAGVDIDAGNALVERIKGTAKRTRRPEVLGGLGGFGALCELPTRYREPVLVSGTDGVGTKLRLAMDLKKHDTIGIDLVAMCVNDLLVVKQLKCQACMKVKITIWQASVWVLLKRAK